jgi:two-component system cell cycle sensor histidine kinase/response regulator CckA
MRALQQPNEAPLQFDLDAVREDGMAIPVQVTLRPQGPQSTMALRTILVVERAKATVAAAAPADDRLARLFHAAPFGVATLGKDGRIVTQNAAFGRLFPAADAAQPASKSIAAGAPVDQGKALDVAIERALAGRAGGAPIEISSGKDGEIARRIYVHPLTVGIDPREAVVVFVADATEQKALELKYAQSQKMEAVGKLAGGIAHDFNNVLTVIIGMSDLLLQARRPTDPGYNDIMQIRSNANRAAGMVGQLLAFSRKQTLTLETLAVNDLVQDYAFSLAKLVGETVDFKHLPGRDLWYVRADKTHFMQVVFNLASNARDAMPTGGKLRIRTRNVSERESLKLGGQGMPAGEYVEIAVEDTGTGMPPEVQAKIFEPFFTTKDVGKGTGLGLSTVYGIVKQTGGFIYLDSAVGKGTTFRIFLPRHIPEADEPIEAGANAKAKPPARDLTGTGRVLLVEDEDGVRSFAVRALQRQGYEVLEAASGVEALEVMEAEGGRVDIVVSDVIMPEMDGPTMYKEMLKTKPDLKIIFVSGYPRDAFDNSLDPDTDFSFLPKPFTLPQLAAKVKEQLGR